MCFGGIIYLIYRENTYISNFVELFIELDIIRSFRPFADSVFVNGYLCDYLWALSFTSAFNYLFYEEKRLYAIYLFVISCGIVWEIAQLKGFVGGVFDCTDIIMYLMAVLTVVLMIKQLLKHLK